MKIIDKTRPATHELIDYEIDDVIKTSRGNLYMIVTDEVNFKVGVFNLTTNSVVALYNNVNELEEQFNFGHDQLVKATLVIE